MLLIANRIELLQSSPGISYRNRVAKVGTRAGQPAKSKHDDFTKDAQHNL
jgi:hypothetical protein